MLNAAQTIPHPSLLAIEQWAIIQEQKFRTFDQLHAQDMELRLIFVVRETLNFRWEIR